MNAAENCGCLCMWIEKKFPATAKSILESPKMSGNTGWSLKTY